MAFERFTDKARNVLALAQEEARSLKQPYVGTEHMLLGLLREREGLAAGSRAEVEHLFARFRAREQGNDLAALVLNLEPALLVAFVGLHVGRAGICGTRGDAQAVGGNGAGLGIEARKAFSGAVAGRFERVGTHVERRAGGHALPFRDPVLAEIALERRGEPFGHIGADMTTLAAMLRIPVAMSNVPAESVFRPHVWGLLGADDPTGADYRACRLFGPVYG